MLQNVGQGQRWKAAKRLKFRKSFKVCKSEFDHLLLLYASKSLRMFNIIIKIVKLFLNDTLLATISFYTEVQCFERWDKVKLKNWEVTRVLAEQLRTNDKRHTIARVVDRFFLTASVILQLFNSDFMEHFDIQLFVLWHNHNK